MTNELKRLAPPASIAEHARRVSPSLADAASREGLLDVAFSFVGSPLGQLLVAVTPRGLVRVAFEDEGRDEVLEELARDLSPRILESPGATDEITRELAEYFAGERRSFAVSLDRRLMRGIARDVLSATARVPFGQTTTYGRIAERIGKPRAARAVGNALGSNPIPIVVPCHRVLRAGGALGGYGGGVERKEALLELERLRPHGS
jgi:methylated-DNA-[protein]-cysteine S-methyltransferase